MFGYHQGMATQQQIAEARRITDGGEPYTDEQIAAYLDAGNTVTKWARIFWESKAATYSSLVNVSESGSSRNNGDLYKNALAMAKHFGEDEVPAVDLSARKTTRQARRR